MKKILFLGCCFFLMMSGVGATSMVCPTVASPGEEIAIQVSDRELNGLKAKYSFGDGFNYQVLNVNSGSIYYDGSDGFSVGNVINQEGIDANIKIKVGVDVASNKDYVLNLIEVSGSNKEYKSIDISNLSCNIKIVNDINTLDSLDVDSVKLNPNFNKNVVSYQGTTDKDKINIKAIASDNGAKIEGSIGEQVLNLGVNYFVIKVTSARGNVREYKLYITRTSNKDDNKNNSSNNNNNGNNDNSSNVKLSSDASLKSLTISKGTLKFKKDIFLYNADVENNVEKVEVKAVANSDKASVVIDNPDKLEVGENVIKVEVTAEDGTKVIYMIVVNRKRKLSSDNFIKDIKIKNYNLNFKKNVYKYNLEIDGEDKLNIDVILSDEKAKYVIKGNKNLKSGSVISIVVTAEDGKERTYEIAINKLGENDASNIINNLSLVSIIGFILLIVVVLIVKAFKSKVNKNIDK